MNALFLLLGFAFMSSVVLAQSQPLVIAHRGASGYLPEHTLEAKAMAHALGADYIEQDIVLSRDNVPVVLHDIHVDTVTDVAEQFPDRKRADGRFYALDFTVAELKQLRVTERFDPRTGVAVFPRRFPRGKSSFQIATLAEELEMIQGLNRSTGRVAGIYSELKQPAWHRTQGRDLSRAVLPLLVAHGYATKADPVFLQCFEFAEVRRLRVELGWPGRLVMLLESAGKGDDGTDFDALESAAGLKELAAWVDGIGPPVGRVVTWAAGGQPKFSELVRRAHAENLVVHPYTMRSDALPSGCPDVAALHTALFGVARVDGVFTDFPDVTLRWIATHARVSP